MVIFKAWFLANAANGYAKSMHDGSIEEGIVELIRLWSVAFGRYLEQTRYIYPGAPIAAHMLDFAKARFAVDRDNYVPLAGIHDLWLYLWAACLWGKLITKRELKREIALLERLASISPDKTIKF